MRRPVRRSDIFGMHVRDHRTRQISGQDLAPTDRREALSNCSFSQVDLRDPRAPLRLSATPRSAFQSLRSADVIVGIMADSSFEYLLGGMGVAPGHVPPFRAELPWCAAFLAREQ